MNDVQSRIFRIPSAEDDFKRRIVLLKKTFEIALEVRLEAMKRLEECDRRQICLIRMSVCTSESRAPRNDQKQVNRAGYKTDRRHEDEKFQHAKIQTL